MTSNAQVSKRQLKNSIVSNNDYLNFIKSNHNMIEQHFLNQFEHPYKKSLIKSYSLKNEKNYSHNPYDKYQYKMKNLKIYTDNEVTSIRSKGDDNIFKKNYTNPQKYPYNSLNFFKPSTQTINAQNPIKSKQLISTKNQQIMNELLRSKQNISQVIYQNKHIQNVNNYHRSLSLQQPKYMSDDNNMIKQGSKEIKHRYSKQFIKQNQPNQQIQQLQKFTKYQNLLPILKLKHKSQYQDLLPSLLPHKQIKDQTLGLLYQYKTQKKQKYLSSEINRLRKQFQQNSDAIKMYKKVQKNNHALNVRQINQQKQIKSYYQYQNLIKNKQINKLLERQKQINQHINKNQKPKNPNLIQNSHNIKLKFDRNISLQSLKQKLQSLKQNQQQTERYLIDQTQQQNIQNDSIINTQQFLQVSKELLMLNKHSKKQQSIQCQQLQKKKKILLQNPPINKYSPQNTIYQNKIKIFRDFYFQMNFIHRQFNLCYVKQGTIRNQEKFKLYVGKGNNSLLVKSLIKRRFWWILVDQPKDAHFVWTQLKINQLYQYQNKPNILFKHYKIQQQQIQDKTVQRKPKKVKQKQIQQKQKKSNIFKAPLPQDDEMKIFTSYDKSIYKRYKQLSAQLNPQKLQNFKKRLNYFPQNYFQVTPSPQQISYQNEQQKNEQSSLKIDQRMHNHFEFNHFIGNKKALFYNLRYYCEIMKKDVFSMVPLTFHIKKGKKDPQYSLFLQHFKKLQKQKSQKKSTSIKQKNIWIIKPGEVSNRGNGIQVFDQLYQINNILKKKQVHKNGQQMTYIVQKYIQNPLLYKNRKFDIRHYMLITRLYGKMRVYFFAEGYIRTSSYQFSITDVTDTEIHLTNDAIQKHSEHYGKYEEGNKLSYVEFQRYLDNLTKQQNLTAKKTSNKQKKPPSFANDIYPQMKQIALQAVKSCFLTIDPKCSEHNFQIFGLDFMIDKELKCWLIQINTNPCLQLSSKLLERIIPTMLQQSLHLSLDIIFPPPYHYPNTSKHFMSDYSLEKLKFQLIFDQDRDGKQLDQMYQKQREMEKLKGKKNVHQMLMNDIDQEDQTYQSQGKEFNGVNESNQDHI